MNFEETKLQGAYVISPELLEDSRGFFAREFCKEQYEAYGLNSNIVQCNMSFNHLAGTVRGMHFQLPPHQEVKIVRCTQGAIFDVIVDLRKESKTFKQWVGVELTAQNRKHLYVPAGFAHGYQTLVDSTEVAYQVTEYYTPGSERGVKWSDPAFDISWPKPVSCISDKDRQHPVYQL